MSSSGYAYSVMSKSDGSWYWEITIIECTGIIGVGVATAVEEYRYNSDGNKWTSGISSPYGNTFTNNDVIGIALKITDSTGEVWFSKNGVWQDSGNPVTGINPAFIGIDTPIYAYIHFDTDQDDAIANFGDSPFSYYAYGYNPGLCNPTSTSTTTTTTTTTTVSTSTTTTTLPELELIFGGLHNTVVIDENGKGWAFGVNTSGQLGHNNTTPYCTPVAVCGSHNFCHVGGGSGYAEHSLAIDSDGQGWAWGKNNFGQLGINNTSNYCTPIAIDGTSHTFCHISAGWTHSLAIDNHGQTWGWGKSDLGQLGDNTTVSKRTPVAVCGGHTFCKITAGADHSISIDSSGQTWGWGKNNLGQLGDNTTVSKRTPVAVCGGHTFCKITAGYSHSLGLDNHGQAWGWGWNNGCLGTNNVTNESTPVAVCGGHNFCYIAAGAGHSLAIDNYGQAWGWGDNTYGQLGDNKGGPTISVSTPVAVCGGHTFCYIAAGFIHSIGLDNYNCVWTWGGGSLGELGNGGHAAVYVPVLVANQVGCVIPSTSSTTTTTTTSSTSSTTTTL